MTTARPAAATTDALFRWIEEREREHCSSFGNAWGRVLDAGTGRHSLTWLLRGTATPDRITDVVAVTGELPLANDLTAAFDKESTRLTVRVGNWQDATFLAKEQTFDVIIADYLVGAMEGFAPYYQDEICARLEELLTPGGRIYLVGLQPLSESQAPADGSNNSLELLETGKLIQEVARTRDACLLLAGRRVYREFPIEWSQRQLEKAGMAVTDSVRFVNVYTRAGITRQLEVGRRYVPLLKDTALRDHLFQALDRLDQRIEEKFGSANAAHDEQRKIRFGFDYVVAARKATIPRAGAGTSKGEPDVQ